MNQSIAKGHCYCGAVRFEASGEPDWISHCHCESCRRHSASAMATFVGYKPDQVIFTADQPVSHVADEAVKRSFCGKCGSPISYESPRWTDQIHLYLGVFDEPGKFEPKDHVYCEEKIGWLKFDDGLPCHNGSGDGN
jgi:hypothetical protein